MAGPHLNWIRAHAKKLDRNLRGELMNTLRVPRWVPCTVASAFIRMVQRFRRLQVIVQTVSECSENERARVIEKLGQIRCKGTCDLPIIGGIVTRAPVSSIETIASDHRVRRVVLDRPVHTLMDVAAPTVAAGEVWDAGATGEGVTVAVVDTGIYPHDDFIVPTSRLVAFADFVRQRSTPYDDNGHGTHVAGIVAGNGTRSEGRYRGIAPNANLAGVKVLDAQGSGTLSMVIRGIQWCVQHKNEHNIRVINLSLGAPAQGSYKDDPMAQAVETAWEEGLVVCAAAGNDGPERQTISTPGIHPRIITVGADDDLGTVSRRDDSVAYFSSRGPTPDGMVKPDVVAPGVDITATNSVKSSIAIQQGNSYADYITLSGTSMATPVCSGIVALMLEKEPILVPDSVKLRLKASAQSLGAEPNAQGRGLVDANSAVDPAVLGGRDGVEA